MISTRGKLAAGGAALVAGAGLALILVTGNAGATTPGGTPASPPAGVVVTKSVAPGATIKPDPRAVRPTATISASAGPAAQQAFKDKHSDGATVTVTPTPGVTIAVPAGKGPTSTVSAPGK